MSWQRRKKLCKYKHLRWRQKIKNQLSKSKKNGGKEGDRSLAGAVSGGRLRWGSRQRWREMAVMRVTVLLMMTTTPEGRKSG